MNEKRSQLEVSNTAAAFQCQTIYSLCPAVIMTVITKHISGTKKYLQSYNKSTTK